MKIVVASDSFKGCLSSAEVADAIESGIATIAEDIDIIKLEVADGGEGTADVIGRSLNGESIFGRTLSACGEKMSTRYWIIRNDTAVIDVASSCGIEHVGSTPNVINYSTFGLGIVVLDAFNKGCRKFIIGLGGSATCDGGLGLLSALGVKFSPRLSRSFPIADDMKNVEYFDLTDARRDIMDCEFVVLSDVTNPLYGPDGAAEIFAPQKGATPDQVKILDEGLRHLSRIGKESTGTDRSLDPGAGAAGGLGWAFLTFFNSRMESGVSGVLDITGFNEIVKDADLVITGEGRMDNQTMSGKLPMGVCRRAQYYGVPTVALAGTVDNALDLLHAGFAGVFSIIPRPMTLQDAMIGENAKESIRNMAASIVKLFVGRKK
ncbi:MAG: glycerate kinase [Muribaculaceae bacterium]|nr:glycerate kinase [Muribaculaceae bacterium]